MIYGLIILSLGILSLIFRNVKLECQIEKKDTLILSHQENLNLITIEQKNIMSLNKMCIEKWEKSVLDNANLNQSNYQLMNLIAQLKGPQDQG